MILSVLYNINKKKIEYILNAVKGTVLGTGTPMVSSKVVQPTATVSSVPVSGPSKNSTSYPKVEIGYKRLKYFGYIFSKRIFVSHDSG